MYQMHDRVIRIVRRGWQSVILLLLFLVNILFAVGQQRQTYFAPYGKVHTPKGHLHLLIIFVRYEDKKLFDSPGWPDSSEPGALPNFAKGGHNELFYSDTSYFQSGERTHNLSDYFYTMSDGQFQVTADIYPLQVPIRYLTNTRATFFSRQGQMNQEAIKWIATHDSTFDWSRYDLRTNNPNFQQDNQKSLPDSILDYVIFMHRAPGLTGIGSPGNLGIPQTPFRINCGHTSIECYSDVEHNWRYMTHEMAHNFFNAPHYMGANSSDGYRYYMQKGWGMMCGWGTPFFSANAWECWWQDWINPRVISRPGRYELGDFLTTKEAICVSIPGSKDVLWIENRQKKDPWDRKIFYNDTLQTDQELSAKGPYMYTVGGVGSDRAQVSLNPFDKRHVNFIRTSHGLGNFDYEILPEKYQDRFWVFRAKRANPFAGQNEFQGIRLDYDKNGRIDVPKRHGNKDGGRREEEEIWVKEVDGEIQEKYFSTGGSKAALQVRDEVGLSGKFPVTNFPMYDPHSQTLSPYLVTGTRIKFLRQKRDGRIILDIRFDDWNIRKHTFWSGPLLVTPPKDTSDIQWISLMPNIVLTVGLSGTPQRETIHPETGTFANPTTLTFPASTGLHLKKGSTLLIDAFSKVIFEPGSWLRVDKGAKVVQQDGGKIVVDTEQLLLQKGAIWEGITLKE